MFWIIAFSLTVFGALGQIALAGPDGWSAHAAAEIGLVWIVAGFYGIATMLAGLQHLTNPDRIARYIGWAAGSGFQLELGWAEVGLSIAGILAIWLRGAYLLAPAIATSTLYLGAALVHARDLARNGNLNPGNAGPVFYIDIVMPMFTIVALALYFR